MGIRENQKGFGAIWILLILAVLVVVAGEAYFVYKNHGKNSKTPKTAQSITQSTSNTKTSSSPSIKTSPSPQPSVSYFTIREWGVRAPLSGNLGLTYSINANNANWAWLNSQQLASADSNCKLVVNSGNAGAIGKYLPTDNISTDSVPQTAQHFLSQDFAASGSAKPDYTKIGDYYYIYWPTQNSCTTDTTLINQVRVEIGSIVDSLQPLSN